MSDDILFTSVIGSDQVWVYYASDLFVLQFLYNSNAMTKKLREAESSSPEAVMP